MDFFCYGSRRRAETYIPEQGMYLDDRDVLLERTTKSSYSKVVPYRYRYVLLVCVPGFDLVPGSHVDGLVDAHPHVVGQVMLTYIYNKKTLRQPETTVLAYRQSSYWTWTLDSEHLL